MIEWIGLAAGTSFAAGLNLYATVATLGLLQRFGVATLPPSLAPLSHPAVITVALVLFVVEFVADKIPFFDNVWDAIHTVIRPPAAAILAYAAVAGIDEPWRVIAALVAGGVALTSHGTKASARAAVNTSPEPISNGVLSVTEDAIAIGLAWLAATHPVLTLVLTAFLMVAAIVALTLIYRLLKRVFGSGPASRPAT
jgi:uncharacterized protein DUF4126